MYIEIGEAIEKMVVCITIGELLSMTSLSSHVASMDFSSGQSTCLSLAIINHGSDLGYGRLSRLIGCVPIGVQMRRLPGPQGCKAGSKKTVYCWDLKGVRLNA